MLDKQCLLNIFDINLVEIIQKKIPLNDLNKF